MPYAKSQGVRIHYHDTGIGWQFATGGDADDVSVQLAPGVKVSLPSNVVDSVAEPPPSDLGRYAVTQDPLDRWRYKTPSLRNVDLTAPYMHNGILGTLEEVANFYNEGGIPNPQLDEAIHPYVYVDAGFRPLASWSDGT